MTWWEDFISNFIQTEFQLFFGFFSTTPLVQEASTTVEGIALFLANFVGWIAPLAGLAPTLLIVWFLDVSVTALMTGNVAPLGNFMMMITSIVVGVGQGLADALPF